LMRRTYPFLSPSALMIRANLIRSRDPFYQGPSLEADVDVMYELLKHHDFGFVPQVLSFVRRHDSSATSMLAKPLNTLLPQNLGLLVKHGPNFLSKEEFQQETRTRYRKYYQFLGKSIFKNQHEDFWIYHKDAMRELGHPMSALQLYIFWLMHCLNNVKKRIEKFQITRLIRSVD